MWSRIHFLSLSLTLFVVAIDAEATMDILVLCGGSRVERYNSTTGGFMDHFIPDSHTAFNGATEMIYGSDGNLLFLSDSTVTRCDSVTGAYINQFVSVGSAGLNGATSMEFGPDGNLYISTIHGNVNRYDGTTGAFIDYFIPTQGSWLNGADDMLFTPEPSSVLFLTLGMVVLRKRKQV